LQGAGWLALQQGDLEAAVRRWDAALAAARALGDRSAAFQAIVGLLTVARVRFPEQETYELPRPIVLFGQTGAERAKITGVAERTLDRTADHFDAEGMASLFPPAARADDDRRRVPADLQHRILALKAEYPPFRPHEIAAMSTRPSTGSSRKTSRDCPTSSTTRTARRARSTSGRWRRFVKNVTGMWTPSSDEACTNEAGLRPHADPIRLAGGPSDPAG
jgi:hypothetical protein